jgi:hypothetical protein
MRDFKLYTDVLSNLRELYAVNEAKGYTFRLGGGGAAEVCIEINLPNGHTLVFGDDTEMWYGAAIDAEGDEADCTDLMTDVVGTSKNANLIARGIMACVDTYIRKAA